MMINYNKNKVEGPINSAGSVIIGDGNVIHQSETPVEKLVFDAKNSFKNKGYKNAQEILNKVLLKVFDDPDLYYYLSLSIIAGRRPKCLGASEAAEIIKNLDLAIEKDDSKAHYFYLKAIILYDFYFLNGYSPDISYINETLNTAADANHDKEIIEEMIKHIPGTDKEIIDFIISNIATNE